MSYPRASCVWVLENGYFDCYQRPPGDSLVHLSFLLPWLFLPVMCPAIVLPERASRRLGPEREKKDKGIQPLGRLSRIVGRALVVPPPMPMVFSVRNYVRAAWISSLDWDWDGGRIARRALNMPCNLVAVYSGLA